jgi:hypothetical protein
MEAGRAALAERGHDAAWASARAALDVLEHPLLPGFEAPWLDERRAELEEERLDALELLARGALAGGDESVAQAQAAARRLVSLAPYRESGYGLLMEAHVRRGNLAEALQVFERLRVLMREELGTTPSADLRAAHERLLAQLDEPAAAEQEATPGSEAAAVPPAEAARAAPPLPLPAPLSTAARRPFVGREQAQVRLRDASEAASEGRRGLVFVGGEPGIGKTSLAAAFAGEARDGGATVLYGRCDEDALTPYQPFVEVITHCVVHGRIDELREELRFELEELGRLVPELRRYLPVMRDSSAGMPDAERYRLFEAVVATLSRLSGTGTLVLILDDLHWADPPTIRLLRHVARAPQPERLLVVGAFRDVELEPGSPLSELLADMRREDGFTLLSLGGLDDREARELISTQRPEELPPGAAERLREMTAGNPFFLGEALRVLAESGEEGMSAEVALERLGLPEGVREVVLQRIERVGPHARELLTLAAVAGDPFRIGVLEAVGDGGGDTVEVLERAGRARLLVETGQADSLAFSHALIREALYGDLSDARRIRLHEQVAETLESRRAELRPLPAELARHYFEARHAVGPEPAIHWAREAADRAAKSLAWEEAAVQLERALEADSLRDAANPEDRCELLLDLGSTRLRAGHPGFRRTFAEAAELAKGRSPRQLGLAAIGYGGRYYEAGVIDDALIALLEDALASVGSEHGDLRARLLARLAEILHFAGEQERALSLSEEALGLARRLGDAEVLAAALAGRHVALLHVAHLEERLPVHAEMLDVARRTGDREREVEGLNARIFDLLQLGQVADARQELEKLRELAEELRQPLFRHSVVGWACSFAQLEGRLEEAERLAVESFEIRTRLETHDAASVFAAQLFAIRRTQGRLGELLPAVEEFIEQYPRLAAWRAALPLILHAAGEAKRARAELARLGSDLGAIPGDFFWLTAMSMLGEGAAVLGDARLAADVYQRLAPYASRTIQVGYSGNQGPVAAVLGLLAVTLERREAARSHFEEARRQSADSGAVIFEVRAAAELATLLSRSEDPADRKRAAEVATEALPKALPLGMSNLIDRLERHLV